MILLINVGIKLAVHDKASLLRSVVLSANDGIITTFAIVTGSLGASLSPTVVLILGFANLFADGFSMATGNYLGIKSEIELEKKEGQNISIGNKPMKNGIITFFSFVVAGFVPLFPYVLKLKNSFVFSCVLVAITLIVVGFIRGVYTGKNKLKIATENLIIGGLAAVVAYGVGFLVDKYLI